MSTNEPPVEPAAEPPEWRPLSAPNPDAVGDEAEKQGPSWASGASEELKQPWTPPSVSESGSDAPVPPPPDTSPAPPPPPPPPPSVPPAGTPPAMTPPPPPPPGQMPPPAVPAATAAAGGAPGMPAGPPSYPPYMPPAAAAAPGPRSRPAVVTVAATLLLILAILQLIQALIGLVSMASTVDRFRDRANAIGATPSDIDDHVSQLRVTYVLGMVFAILLAILLAGLAYGLFRGSNGARIATWVVAGIAIICDCCSSFLYFGANGINFNGNNTNSMESQLAQAQLDALPAWYLATGGGISLLQLLGYIAVAVLLALPASNAFFRKVAPGWVPPTP